MELKIGETYRIKNAETNAECGITFLKEGAKVLLQVWTAPNVIVQDLSEDKVEDGVWMTYADNLITEEEYQAMQGSDKGTDDEPEPMKLEKGAIYVMKRSEVSGMNGRVYIKKGARVRVDMSGIISVLVEDLSKDKVDDGVWMTSVDALMPLEDALNVGEVYCMGEDEKSADGSVTFISKGAKVRFLRPLRSCKGRCEVQDLSEDKTGDGRWLTDMMKLIPIDKPEGSISQKEAEAQYKNADCMVDVMVQENKSDIAPIVPLEDMVVVKNKNEHYVSEHQPIETMQANMTQDELIGFLKGNIIKYACRCGKKDEPLKEAEKIKQYADWLCIVLSGGTIDPRAN